MAYSYVIWGADFKNHPSKHPFPVSEALFAKTCTCISFYRSLYGIFAPLDVMQICAHGLFLCNWGCWFQKWPVQTYIVCQWGVICKNMYMYFLLQVLTTYSLHQTWCKCGNDLIFCNWRLWFQIFYIGIIWKLYMITINKMAMYIVEEHVHCNCMCRPTLFSFFER